MKKTILTITAILAVICGQTIADIIEDSVSMTPDGYGAKGTVTITGGGWTNKSVYAGAAMFNVIAATGNGQYLAGNTIGGFCVDLAEYIANSTETYSLIDTAEGPVPNTFLGGSLGQQKADYLAELWGRYYDNSWANATSYTDQQKREAEAFAVAVWEIVYEQLPASSGQWDVSSDGTEGQLGFAATGLDASLANSWLSSLDGTGPKAMLVIASNDGIQDIITAIPEPATVALLAAGGLMFVFNKKKYA